MPQSAHPKPERPIEHLMMDFIKLTQDPRFNIQDFIVIEHVHEICITNLFLR